MNLLLLHPHEVGTDGRVLLDDRRSAHCHSVLRVDVGSSLRVGVVNQGSCTARVSALSDGRLELQLGPLKSATPSLLRLALAIPRPKALSRILATSASFGVESITLFSAWKVERSYLSSPRLVPERMKQDLLLGMEQGMQCRLPTISIHDRFVDFVDALSAPEPSEVRVVLHPGVAAGLDQAGLPPSTRLYLVLGPEGGFIPRELESLQTVGFQMADLGTGPLRTETAVAAALGQVVLLRRLNDPSGPHPRMACRISFPSSAAR